MKKPFKLTEQRKEQLKVCTVAYLRGLHPQLNELEHALMAPNALMPKAKLSGAFLLEPDMVMNEAHYLESGLAILYTIHAKTGLMKIFYIWEEHSIIVLFEEFIDKLPVGDYYIQLIEDSELVSISNFCMDDIYEEHTVAYLLTQKILSLKTRRRMLQTDILLMDAKVDRPAAFEKMFPNLRNRLTREQICAFIGVKPSTLDNGKG
jgi:hypothetical protein